MSTVESEVFKISWRSGLVVVFSTLFALMLIALWPWGLPVVLASGGVWLAMTLLLPAVSVGDHGLVLYCVNRLLWHQVVAVRPSKILGLPYLVITRHKGMRWWVPLYVVGKRPLLTALAARAPAGNPLQVFAAAASNNSFKPKPLRGSA